MIALGAYLKNAAGPVPVVVRFGTLDVIGVSLFVLFTVVYHALYYVYTQTRPLATVKGKIHLYRRTWVKRILDRGDFLLAAQTLRNHLMAASFMASSALLAIGLLLNFVVAGDPAAALHLDNAELITFKLFVLIGLFAFSFMAFLFTIRDLNHVSILVAADADLIDHVEGLDAVTYLSMLLNQALNRYTFGQRGFYFSLAIIAWIFHPLAFIFTTLGIGLLLILVLDFQRWNLPRVLQARFGQEQMQQDAAEAAAAVRGDAARDARSGETGKG